MKYKGILIDIDDTLYDFGYAQNKALEKVSEFLSKVLNIDYEAVVPCYFKARQEIGERYGETPPAHNRLLYFQRMFETLNIDNLQYALKAYNLYWDTFIDNMIVFEGVYEFFETLSKQKICFVTDMMADIQYRKVIKMGFDKYVNLMATCEESGKDKPAPESFILGLKKVGLNADEVCMIGDNFEKDIVGAVNLGIESIWFDRKNGRQPDNKMVTRVESFKEMAELLRK